MRRGTFGWAGRTPPWSTKRSEHCWSDTDPLRWTPATPPMTCTRSTSRMSGATWPPGDEQPPPRERSAGSWRGLVVRDTRDRSPPGRRPVAGCSDSSTSTSTCCALHDDGAGPRERGRPRTRRRSRAASLGGESGLHRERLGRGLGPTTWSTGGLADANGLRSPCDRRRLHLTPSLRGWIRCGDDSGASPSGKRPGISGSW